MPIFESLIFFIGMFSIALTTFILLIMIAGTYLSDDDDGLCDNHRFEDIGENSEVVYEDINKNGIRYGMKTINYRSCKKCHLRIQDEGNVEEYFIESQPLNDSDA